MKTRVTVVICSYNRCDSLTDTLKSLQSMNVPDHIDWDVVVVDNNSTDRTRESVERVQDETGLRVSYLLEKKQGLSHARNLGITSTDAEYIAFTDDDVFVHRDWLKNIIDTFVTNKADGVGGKVLPYWIGTRPPWLTDNLLGVLAMLDYGETPFQFPEKDGRILFGANFAFRRDVLLQMGMFDVRLGRKGDVGGGEDQEMFNKLKRSGGRLYYSPSIAVSHKAPPDRVTKRYFIKWFYAAGRDRAKITLENKATLFGIERHLYIDFVRAMLALLSNVVRPQSKYLFSSELNCILYLSLFRHKIFKSQEWNGSHVL